MNNFERENEMLEEFDMEASTNSTDELFQRRPKSRYCKPKFHKSINPRLIKYSNAKKLAVDIIQSGWLGERIDVLCAGNFIFGDFIEAFINEAGIDCELLQCSTLGMSVENIASFENLFDSGAVDKLNLIVSAYFFAHERHKLVKMMYEKLDKENKFQLAVCANHAKVVLIKSGKYRFIISGSANLRSSDCIEQFTIENNKELYDFYDEYFSAVIEDYSTIGKIKRGKTLWRQVVIKD